MYDVQTIDLTLAFDNRKVVPQATQVGSVTITQLPAGATMQFKIGNGPWVTARDGLTIDGLDPKAEGNLGVFARNATAQPGVNVEMFIGLAPTEPTNIRN